MTILLKNANANKAENRSVPAFQDGLDLELQMNQRALELFYLSAQRCFQDSEVLKFFGSLSGECRVVAASVPIHYGD